LEFGEGWVRSRHGCRGDCQAFYRSEYWIDLHFSPSPKTVCF
jgi:hypothetical protein